MQYCSNDVLVYLGTYIKFFYIKISKVDLIAVIYFNYNNNKQYNETSKGYPTASTSNTCNLATAPWLSL